LVVPDDATGLPEGARVRISTATPPNADAVAVLQRWAAEDDNLTDAEAAENAAVLRAVDAARPSYRKLIACPLGDDGGLAG
jgi:hypothetical protein